MRRFGSVGLVGATAHTFNGHGEPARLDRSRLRPLPACMQCACVCSRPSHRAREVSVSEKHHIYLGTWELLVANKAVDVELQRSERSLVLH
jgi:hypothetical protein